MFFTRIAFFLVLGLCFSISFAAKDLLELYNEKVGSAADVVIAEMSKQLKDIASSGDYAAVSKSLRSLGVAQMINLKESKVQRSRKEKSSVSDSEYLPVIQMHGMGDFAKDPSGMVPLANAVSTELNGTYVLNVQIGENSIADILNGFLMNLDDQVDYFANVIRSDAHFANGLNAIGYSQGNLVIRGYIERYNSPPIKNFISMHGPLAGVAAFPGCSFDHNFCKAFTELLGALAYHPTVQQHLTQANYFRDPFKIENYQANAIFLPDINNEDSTVNAAYASNWESLNSLCLVKALGDTVVIPNESEWFGFYHDKSFEKIWTYDQTPWYRQDLFGLKTLKTAGKLHFETTDENHLDFSTEYLLSLVDTYFK